MKKRYVVIVAITLILFAGFTGCVYEDDTADVEVEVVEAEIRSEDMEGDPPEEGNIFLFLNISANMSEEGDPVGLDPSYFTLETEEREEYEYADYNHDEFPFFPNASEEENFWLGFEIQENETASELIYDPLEEDPQRIDVPPYEQITV
ncbi:MAG: hypothetical protein ACOCTR_01835 [Candidatus Natronoplasma sp.]